MMARFQHVHKGVHMAHRCPNALVQLRADDATEDRVQIGRRHQQHRAVGREGGARWGVSVSCRRSRERAWRSERAS